MANVSKKELVHRIWESNPKIPNKEVANIVVTDMIDLIASILANTDDQIRLPGLGIFSTKLVEQRQGVGFDGHPVEIRAHKRINFNASSVVKKRMVR